MTVEIAPERAGPRKINDKLVHLIHNLVPPHSCHHRIGPQTFTASLPALRASDKRRRSRPLCPLWVKSGHCRFRKLREGTSLFVPVPIGLHAVRRTGMKLPRRQFLHLAAGAGALPIVLGVAKAQAYPSR